MFLQNRNISHKYLKFYDIQRFLFNWFFWNSRIKCTSETCLYYQIVVHICCISSACLYTWTHTKMSGFSGRIQAKEVTVKFLIQYLVQCWVFIRPCFNREGTSVYYRKHMRQCTCITGSATKGWMCLYGRAVCPWDTSILTVKTLSTPWLRKFRLKEGQSKTLKTFCLDKNQPRTRIPWSLLAECNLCEKPSISKDFLYCVPQQIVPREGAYSISVLCLFLETCEYGNGGMEADF